MTLEVEILVVGTLLLRLPRIFMEIGYAAAVVFEVFDGFTEAIRWARLFEAIL